MAVGDRLNIADKSTLDSVKQDTSGLVFKDNKLKMLDFTGLNNKVLFPDSSKTYIPSIIDNKILIINSASNDPIVRIYDINLNFLSSINLGLTTKYNNYLFLTDTKILFFGTDGASYVMRILDLSTLIMGNFFNTGINATSFTFLNLFFANNKLYLVVKDASPVYYCYSFDVNLATNTMSNKTTVNNGTSFTNGANLKLITYNEITSKYYIFISNNCYEASDVANAIYNNFAVGSYISVLSTTYVPYQDLGTPTYIVGYRPPKIINGVMYFYVYPNSSTGICSIIPVALDLNTKTMKPFSQLSTTYLIGSYGTSGMRSYFEFNNKPYYVYLSNSRVQEATYYINRELDLTLFVGSIATSNGVTKCYKIDLGTLLKIDNLKSFIINCGVYNDGNSIKLFITEKCVDSTSYDPVFLFLDITDYIKEVEARCLLE